MANEVITSWTLYRRKHDHFKKLSDVHADHVPQWFFMDKAPKTVDGGVKSVYLHSVSKGKKILMNLIVTLLKLY